MNRSNKGFTLLELAIVGLIAGIIFAAAALLMTSTDDAYNTVREDTEANFSLRRALNRVADELRQSASSVITVTAGFNHDQIDLQVPVSKVGDTVNWGAAGQVGWHVRVLVEDGVLIRRVVDGSGIQQRVDETLATDVDDFFDGQKGFSVTQNDGLYVIALRVVARRNEREWRRSEITSVTTRN